MLRGLEKKYLRGLAHHLKPVVLVGKNGLTESLLAAIESALDDHELIKVKFNEFKEEKKTLSKEMERKSKAELVGLIGNVAIFYRRQAEASKRKIKLPQSKDG